MDAANGGSAAPRKRALITGITGQDGAYLAELLLGKGYEVHGIKRRASQLNTQRIDKFYEEPQFRRRLVLHYGDLSDSTCLVRIVQLVQPDEIYNLGAQSHVAVSFESPEYTADVDGIGALRLLDAIRICGLEKKTRFYQASTSELYGKVREVPQRITTPFYPRSPYAVAKLYAFWITVNYREAYGIFACNGVLFNHGAAFVCFGALACCLRLVLCCECIIAAGRPHNTKQTTTQTKTKQPTLNETESPLRGETFVTRKITRGLARIKVGLQQCLYLGNLDARRDWGHARDYVEMQWLMLQQDEPRDYVIATGASRNRDQERQCLLSACLCGLGREGAGGGHMVLEGGAFGGQGWRCAVAFSVAAPSNTSPHYTTITLPSNTLPPPTPTQPQPTQPQPV